MIQKRPETDKQPVMVFVLAEQVYYYVISYLLVYPSIEWCQITPV